MQAPLISSGAAGYRTIDVNARYGSLTMTPIVTPSRTMVHGAVRVRDQHPGNHASIRSWCSPGHALCKAGGIMLHAPSLI